MEISIKFEMRIFGDLRNISYFVSLRVKARSVSFGEYVELLGLNIWWPMGVQGDVYIDVS